MQRIDYTERRLIIPFFPPVIDGYGANVHGLVPSKGGLSLNAYDFKHLGYDGPPAPRSGPPGARPAARRKDSPLADRQCPVPAAPPPPAARRTRCGTAVQRLGFGVITLFCVSILVFAATQILPGNAAHRGAAEHATPPRLHALEVQMHLNRPAVAQYWTWLDRAVPRQPRAPPWPAACR